MKTHAMSDNDIRFLIKRSVARNILEGMSIEEAFKHVHLTYEYFNYCISDLDPIDVSTDKENKLNEAMKQISDEQIDEFIKSQKNKTINQMKNKKIGHITSYVFLVMNLVPFECKIYVIYDGTGDGELLGTIKPSPTYDGSLVFSDANRAPLFHITPKVDPPTTLHCHGNTQVIAFIKDVAANFIRHVQQRECIAARKVKNVPKLVEGCHVYTAHPLTAYITYHNPEKEKVSTFNNDQCLADRTAFPTKEQKHTKPDIYQAFAKFIKDCSKNDDIVACCNIFIRTDPNSKEYTEMCTMMNHVTNIAMRDSNNIAAWQSPKFQTLLTMRTAELSGKGIVNLQNGDTVEISKSKNCSKCHTCINRTGCYIEGAVAEIDGFIVSKCDRYHLEANPEEIAKNITQAMVAVENDQSCALFVKDPINGNEYTLNITGFDDDGRLLANVVKTTKGE